jgi:phosphoglycolate phosphatase
MKIIFWDWNGTLVNDAPALWQSFNDMVQGRGGSPVSFERYREMYRHPIRDMYEEVGIDLVQHPFEAIAAEWHDRYDFLSRSLELHHDVVDTLIALQRDGRRQMVLSALPHDFLLTQVERFGIGQYFEHVRGIPDQLAHSKVGPARVLASDLGASGENITVIGDSSHDAEVARELNAECLLIARGAESRTKLERHGYRVFEDFSEIADLLPTI